MTIKPRARTPAYLHSGLNPDQMEAVTAPDGPMLIVAGPGSGKTRVLTHRIAHLITNRDVRPHHIIAMTFTNRAAGEMQDRISRMIPGRTTGVMAGTFHRFCGNLLRNRATLADRRPDFTIYDRDDQRVVAQRALELTGIPRETGQRDDLIWAMGYAKANLLDPEQLELHLHEGLYHGDRTEIMWAMCEPYEAYERMMHAYNAIDFDDMIWKTVQLLEDSPATRRAAESRHRHILVDEFQDTSPAQYRLATLLAGQRANLCVVGDPDQSIYGWRHADIRNILNFREDYPDAVQINLGRNYRSTETIVRAAGEMIRHNTSRIDNPLSSERPPGPPVQVITAEDELDEAEQVMDWLQSLTTDEGIPWQECAVMYRTHRQSRTIEEQCVLRGIPYRVVGGPRFYDREEIRDALAYLRLTSNTGDAVAFQRIVNKPARGIGAKTVANIASWAEQNGATSMQAVAASRGDHLGAAPKFSKRAGQAIENFGQIMDALNADSRNRNLVDLFDSMIQRTGLEQLAKNHERGQERWDNLQELREVCRARSTDQPAAAGDLAAMLQDIITLSQPGDEDQGPLTLTSLHQAKGLEFEAVALTGMNHAILPLLRSEDTEEERRLCYVGITRAKTWLTLSWALTRYGREYYPSQFLDEIPDLTWDEYH